MIAEETGAKEVIKKARRGQAGFSRGLFDEHDNPSEMNIFEILQLFRESQSQRQGEGAGGPGGDRDSQMRIGVDQIHQLLLGAANANDNDFSDGDGINDEDQFGAQFPNAHGELDIEERKLGEHEADDDRFADFHYEFENEGNQNERQRQRI